MTNPISYLKVKEKYLSMQLPQHMGGLHRKNTQEIEEDYNRRHGFKWGGGLRITE